MLGRKLQSIGMPLLTEDDSADSAMHSQIWKARLEQSPLEYTGFPGCNTFATGQDILLRIA